MVVTVFGLGFVGLTLALGFAELGHTIYGYDSDTEKINFLHKGIIPFKEPGLNDLLGKHLHKNFHLVNLGDLNKALNASDFAFYCVGTPSDKEGLVDLSFLKNALYTSMKCKPVGKFLTLVIKSTIPPGTCYNEILPFIEGLGYNKGIDFDLAHNPEFLREGHSLEDFMYAEKIVIGCDNKETFEKIKALYSKLHSQVFEVTPSTAEFIKYLSNTLLATLISFSNEMAEGAETIGSIDVAKAFKILHSDKRWKDSGIIEYIYPGCGYGGYCLPKDTKGLFSNFLGHKYQATILENVIKRNENMALLSAKKIIIKCHKGKDTKIGILGLSFKPESDDARDSPSAKIINELIKEGYNKLFAYDPIANENFKKHYPGLNVKTFDSISELERESDLLVIVTAWQQFKDLKGKIIKPIVNLRYF